METFQFSDGTPVFKADHPLDTCKHCGRSVHFRATSAVYINGNPLGYVAAIYQCPHNSCKKISFVRYLHRPGTYSLTLEESFPKRKPDVSFSEDISETSPQFVKIYNQALNAKEEGHDQICGPGFRKALEFLVKDYLIKVKKKDREKIATKNLQQCIQQDFEHQRTKDVAERCVWLGKDETHFEREWTNRDIEDLIDLTQLVVHHIDADIYGARMVGDMPRREKKK